MPSKNGIFLKDIPTYTSRSRKLINNTTRFKKTGLLQISIKFQMDWNNLQPNFRPMKMKLICCQGKIHTIITRVICFLFDI